MSIPILQEQPSFGGELARQLGTGISEGLSESLANFQKSKEIENITESFKEQGYPENLAKLAAVASKGGQTEILKQLLEMQQRGGLQNFLAPTEIEEKEEVELTPKEKIKREEGRYAKQFDKYSSLTEKASKLDQEQIRLQRLQQLNESGALPKGIGRINVNLKSGELRIPFAASPDSQEFVKIINDFLSGAKETFGARVTNFEVNRFLKRLPSLLNTEEGRRRVLRQMEIINQINELHNQGILDEFDKGGGVRKVDIDVAERKAREKNKDKIKQLQKEYVTGKSPEEKDKKITQNIAKEILKEAKGNREKARKIAKKRGYIF